MTLDEIIEQEKNVYKQNQEIVDTHIWDITDEGEFVSLKDTNIVLTITNKLLSG